MKEYEKEEIKKLKKRDRVNKQIMIKHYETTPKETLIDILVASREEVEKLQNRNKELKQEIERLKELCDKYEEEHKTTFEEWEKTINTIKEVREYANTDKNCVPKHIKDYINDLLDKENK